MRGTAEVANDLPIAWCSPPDAWGRRARRERMGGTIREEAPGYLAALAFLSAYVLMVIGTAPILQAALNLTGSGLAACYLWRKRALPNVLLNGAWAVITMAGLIGSFGPG